MAFVSILILFVGAISIAYFYGLLLASFAYHPVPLKLGPKNKILILVPAHNEEAVIGHTIRRVQEVHYPESLYEIHVVADHCEDGTAACAESAGARVHRRDSGPRGQKGLALSWLFDRVRTLTFDAIVILDADAKIEKNFLLALNTLLEKGEVAVQGQQRISNPKAGWYAALTSALYRIDNLVHNQGRYALGGSARHMGDSICLRKELVEELGFGQGLTEDHSLRQRLLLSGRKIAYASQAIAYNEAAATWKDARVQRMRWMQGTIQGDRESRFVLLKVGLKRRNFPAIEAGLESLLPSYTTLAATVAIFTLVFWSSSWLGLLLAVVFFPFGGLLAAKAPLSDFFALSTGPFFILWRCGLAVSLRLFPREISWVRTPRGQETSS